MELLQPEPGLIFWTVVTFAVLLGILWKFAWNPILGAPAGRVPATPRPTPAAARVPAPAVGVLDDPKARLAEARAEGNRILDEARQAGERMKSEILEKARADAGQVIERAQRQLELETEKALQTVRFRAADMALEAAGKVLERSLTDADHRRLAEEAIAEIAERG